MTFYVNENVSRKLAEILDIFDQHNEVLHLLDAFPAGPPDAQWLTEIGQWEPKPIVLGGDALSRSGMEAPEGLGWRPAGSLARPEGRRS